MWGARPLEGLARDSKQELSSILSAEAIDDITDDDRICWSLYPPRRKAIAVIRWSSTSPVKRTLGCYGLTRAVICAPGAPDYNAMIEVATNGSSSTSSMRSQIAPQPVALVALHVAERVA